MMEGWWQDDGRKMDDGGRMMEKLWKDDGRMMAG